MSSPLNLNELKMMKEELSNTILFVSKEADEALSDDNNQFDDRKWLIAKDEWGKLETKALDLQGRIDEQELDFILNTNVDSPFSRISQATNSLKTAATKIDNFESFLSEIARVISIVTNTITAIETGGLLKFP